MTPEQQQISIAFILFLVVLTALFACMKGGD